MAANLFESYRYCIKRLQEEEKDRALTCSLKTFILHWLVALLVWALNLHLENTGYDTGLLNCKAPGDFHNKLLLLCVFSNRHYLHANNVFTCNNSVVKINLFRGAAVVWKYVLYT